MFMFAAAESCALTHDRDIGACRAACSVFVKFMLPHRFFQPAQTLRANISWCRSVSISRSVSIRKWFFRPFEHIFWFKILIFGRSLPTPNFTGFRLKSTPVAQCLRAMPKHSSRNDLCSLCSFSKREKLHRQFLDGQTDQKLQSLF